MDPLESCSEARCIEDSPTPEHCLNLHKNEPEDPSAKKEPRPRGRPLGSENRLDQSLPEWCASEDPRKYTECGNKPTQAAKNRHEREQQREPEKEGERFHAAKVRRSRFVPVQKRGGGSY